MGLRIIRASEPIEINRITACLYSVPGIGKTSMAYTAEKTLLLDFDKGSHRSKNRGDVVRVEKWDDVVNISQADLAPYKTLAIDTAGRGLDALTVSIIATDPRMGRGGALTQQGYGRLKSEFIAWTKMIHSFGLDVVLLCHSEETKDGDDLKERLDMTGGSKGEVYKSSDLMGRLYIQGGKRMLSFSPSDTSFGKNPAGFDPFVVPDFRETPDFLAQVIAKTKASLNELSASQVAAASAQAAWKERIDAANTAEEFSALIEPLKADELVRDVIKLVLVKAAKEKGFTLSKDKTKFDGAAVDAATAEKPKDDNSPKDQTATAIPGASADSAVSSNGTTTSATTEPAPQPSVKGQRDLLAKGRGKAA